MADVLLREMRGHTLLLTMNRPERLNSLDASLSLALIQAWADYMADDNAWCAVLTGAGRAFSAGADIRAQADRYAAGGDANQRRAPDVPVYKPVIAAINGFAVAGGLLVALRADIRIAAESAQFWMGEVKWSMVTPYKIMLPWYMPMGIAMEMVLTGNRIDARRAYEVGLVNRVVPDDQVLDTALEMAEQICQNSPITVRAHKESLLRCLEIPETTAGPLAREIMTQVTDSEDAREGTRAFAEKRTPVWRNR